MQWTERERKRLYDAVEHFWIVCKNVSKCDAPERMVDQIVHSKEEIFKWMKKADGYKKQLVEGSAPGLKTTVFDNFLSIYMGSFSGPVMPFVRACKEYSEKLSAAEKNAKRSVDIERKKEAARLDEELKRAKGNEDASQKRYEPYKNSVLKRNMHRRDAQNALKELKEHQEEVKRIEAAIKGLDDKWYKKKEEIINLDTQTPKKEFNTAFTEFKKYTEKGFGWVLKIIKETPVG